MADWKQLELFEKEADALRSLSHPGIPAYKDYFEVDSDGDRAYFLVQVSKAYTSVCVHSAHLVYLLLTSCAMSRSFPHHYLSDAITCNALQMPCSVMLYPAALYIFLLSSVIPGPALMQLANFESALCHAFIYSCLSAMSKQRFDSMDAAQELIEGKSLAQMVEAGWQPAQTEVERIAGELLTTFSYLQQQQVWTVACM